MIKEKLKYKMDLNPGPKWVTWVLSRIIYTIILNLTNTCYMLHSRVCAIKELFVSINISIIKVNRLINNIDDKQ